MRIAGSIAVALGVLGAATASLHPRSSDTRDFFALHLDDATSPSHVAQLLGARHEGPIGELVGHHTFSLPRDQNLDSVLADLKQKRQLKRRSESGSAIHEDALDGILWSHRLDAPRQRLHKRLPPPPPSVDLTPRAEKKPDQAAVTAQKDLMSTLDIRDPIFKEQWHLFNTIRPEHSLNVTGLWLEGKDLSPNYYPEGSWDYNAHSPEPRPQLDDDRHGTRCAGEVAASKNDVCGVGVAYDSKVAGIRILSAPIDDHDEAEALNYGFQHNDIYSCSWGPMDDGRTMEGPGVLIRRAMVNGVQNGRQGKGSVFVFAAGNGAPYGDNCNFDGYTNSIYSITVGAIDWKGKHGIYSEACSAQLVVTYSTGSGEAIHTTDVGVNQCINSHGGTSAAGPLVAGTSALVLSVRPELTWRDVQHLFVETAVPVNEDDGSWQTTPSGRKFSHMWGFGKVDAYAVVQRAREWELVKPQAWFNSPWQRVHHEIPQGQKGLISRYTVTEDQLKEANFERLEHVTVTMNVNHTRRGDLSVELRSPGGVVSHLSVTRDRDEAAVGYVDWTFMSVAHWGESAVGVWTVIVKDTEVNDFTGVFTDWRLNLWGEAIDADKQPLLPLPTEHDDDHPYEVAHVGTTSIEPGPVQTNPPAGPGDHIDRPMKKPPPPKPTTEPSPVEDVVTPSPATNATASPTTTDQSKLSPYLPSFGASKMTQVWIYASLGMIIFFCIGLGIYFQISRLKRRRTNPHDDYEFEMIEDEDELQPMTGGSRTRRGGELYNAFAGESDEEVFSDADDDAPYRDRLANVQEEDEDAAEKASPGTGLLSEKR
ncbi:Proprotein convertase P [Penicillium lagena]|uniref:Proprotein convertase P n=1 Tax=Penicillium lagena TaxID=94218 RepID=UPI00254062FD|nr:Proprotein convertase P [Penicillium lagena]KAJ5606277.1 Proprotein convertase P [Penicillium lagena]